ncbi:RNA polymerase sigma factor (plasmid) [Rhizobium sp. RCAM05350]|nr:RNA polymerase sigma factor [Rhizobium sp. RCAM05350]
MQRNGSFADVPQQKKTILQALTESYGDLSRHVARRFRDRADADDVIQDTYLRVRNIPSDVPDRKPTGLFVSNGEQCCDRPCASSTRKSATYLRLKSLTWVQGAVPVDRVIDYRQRLAALERVIADLPSRQCEVFLMHKFDGLSHSEIAAELGITREPIAAWQRRLS